MSFERGILVTRLTELVVQRLELESDIQDLNNRIDNMRDCADDWREESWILTHEIDILTAQIENLE